MSDPKPFASLSSGLLARKGAARPAMRPQGFGQVGAGLDDLGWNDMGFESPKVAPDQRDGAHDAFGEDIVDHPRALHSIGLSPVESPVHGQQAEIADRFGAIAPDESEEFDEDFDETAEIYQPVEDVAAPTPTAAKSFALPVPTEDDYAAAAAETEAAQAKSVTEAEDEDQAADVDDLLLDQPVVPMVSASRPAAPTHPAVLAVVPEKAPRRLPRARSVPGGKSKAAFTLRLDPSRHLKLRLACAVNGRSAQQIVTDALDHLLTTMPELEAMAEKANRKG